MKVSITDLADKANIKFGTSGLRGLVTDLSDCLTKQSSPTESSPAVDALRNL